ncbi:MAG: hypothetical protein K5769_07970 [Pseudobutyrivibrio sp.]|nr:hypothetical protein [Pseudobutyrivibrio sp.]
MRIKKTIKGVLAVALFFTMCFNASIPAKADQMNQVYTALGDSLTDEHTYDGKSWTSYPTYICDDLITNKGINVTLCNHGVGGFTTSDVLNQISTDEAVINDIKSADFITLQVGANNITYAMITSLSDKGLMSLPFEYYLPEGTNVGACEIDAKDVLSNKENEYHQKYITTAKDDLESIITKIREYNPTAPIYIATVYYTQEMFSMLFSSMFALSTYSGEVLADQYGVAAAELRTYFEDAAAYYDNVYFVDNSAACDVYFFQYNEEGRICDIHPNANGQHALAGAFEGAFSLAAKERFKNDTSKALIDKFTALGQKHRAILVK